MAFMLPSPFDSYESKAESFRDSCYCPPAFFLDTAITYRDGTQASPSPTSTAEPGFSNLASRPTAPLQTDDYSRSITNGRTPRRLTSKITMSLRGCEKSGRRAPVRMNPFYIRQYVNVVKLKRQRSSAGLKRDRRM